MNIRRTRHQASHIALIRDPTQSVHDTGTDNFNRPCYSFPPLCLARALRVAADNFDPIGMYLVRVVELEIDIFDNESPHIVAEAVRIEMSLEKPFQQTRLLL